MSAHLAHRERSCRKRQATPEQRKQLTHIARTFARALLEFQQTHQRSAAELDAIDPQIWGGDPVPSHTAVPLYQSLVHGYIDLNLLLTGPSRVEPYMFSRGRRHNYHNLTMLGYHEDEHPPALHERMRPAFYDWEMKPLTPNVLQVLRDHVALLFRSMYIMSGVNWLLDDDFVVDEFFTSTLGGKKKRLTTLAHI